MLHWRRFAACVPTPSAGVRCVRLGEHSATFRCWRRGPSMPFRVVSVLWAFHEIRRPSSNALQYSTAMAMHLFAHSAMVRWNLRPSALSAVSPTAMECEILTTASCRCAFPVVVSGQRCRSRADSTNCERGVHWRWPGIYYCRTVVEEHDQDRTKAVVEVW